MSGSGTGSVEEKAAPSPALHRDMREKRKQSKTAFSGHWRIGRVYSSQRETPSREKQLKNGENGW